MLSKHPLIGNDCGISDNTVNRWLSILQASYIIVLLQPYHHANLGKRLHNQTPNIYLWRDQAGHEIDCILDEGQRVIPIEIKASRTISQRFFENLKLWQATYPSHPAGYVIYAGAADQPRGQSNVISWQTISQVLNYLP